AHGPAEKCGMTGRTAGYSELLMTAPSFQMGRHSVGRGVPATLMPESWEFVNREDMNSKTAVDLSTAAMFKRKLSIEF
ncbi:MAG: hypothetical protein AB7S59_16935, partial [Parvibaculaceae bacterium]